MTATIVVPLSGELDEWRAAAWRYVRARLPYRVEVGEATAVGWSKGRALAAAVDRVCAEVLIVHDADVLVHDVALAACVAACEDGAPWAIPHEWVHRLDKHSTELVYAGLDPALARGRARLPYRGVPGGGVTVLRAETWAACPVDPRFAGWGGEDEAWGWALACLAGAPWRPIGADAHLWHLWHPHPAPRQRTTTDPASRVLRTNYRRARRAPRLMRALIANEAPPPPTRLDPPVRFRLLSGAQRRTLDIAGHAVRFERGETLTDDSDVVEVLDRTAGVARV